MNSYEAERLANIAKNEALLKEIGLTGVRITPAKKVTVTRKSTPRKKTIVTDPVPRRSSSRLSGIPAESEEVKRKVDQEYEARLEQDRVKRQRVSGPVALSDVLQSAIGNWNDASQLLLEVVRASADAPVSKRRKSSALEETIKSMNGLQLLDRWEPNQINITPERIFSIGMHPASSKKMAVAGDKMGHLGIWDIDGVTSSAAVKSEDEDHHEEEEEPRIHHFKTHSRTITAFCFETAKAEKLYSSSYDGSIRCLDLTTGQATETYVAQHDTALTSVELSPGGDTICFSTLDGEVGVKDLRSKDVQLYNLHDRKIGSLGMHPGSPNLICTSSLDRTMKVWDIRKLVGNRKDRRPTLLAEYGCRLSVSSAYFNAQGSVVATSFDDTIKIFDLSDIASWPGGVAAPIEPDYSLQHNNQTGRWLTVFKATWQRAPLDGVQKIVVGNMRRKVDILGGHGEVLAQLEDARVTAVPAVVRMHDSQNWVLAGNASGKALFYS